MWETVRGGGLLTIDNQSCFLKQGPSMLVSHVALQLYKYLNLVFNCLFFKSQQCPSRTQRPCLLNMSFSKLLIMVELELTFNYYLKTD